MNRSVNRGATAVGLLATILLAAPAIADNHDDLATAITSGDASLNLRYRYEYVDQDSFDEDAHASTLRMRLNYQTGSWRDWSGFLEFDHVLEVFLNDYNSGSGTSSGNRNQYPVVADPDGSDLNQVYLQYAPNADWQTRVGRQRILLDDQRYVGGVGWRQNEQTYDGLSVQQLTDNAVGDDEVGLGGSNLVWETGLEAGCRCLMARTFVNSACEVARPATSSPGVRSCGWRLRPVTRLRSATQVFPPCRRRCRSPVPPSCWCADCCLLCGRDGRQG